MAENSKDTASSSSSSFHQMVRKVYEDNKADEKSKSDKKKTTISYKDNIEDFFHPNNIFNRSRNFPTIGHVNSARCAAERILFPNSDKMIDITDTEGHIKAAKLLFLSQANSFQHKFLMRLGSKLIRKAENPEEGDQEDVVFCRNQRDQMVFESFDKTTIIDKSANLPSNWTIVQMSGHDFLVSRFRHLKAQQPLNTNPALTVVRLCRGQVRVARCEASSQHCTSFMKECKEIRDQNVAIVREHINSVKNNDKSKNKQSKASEKASYWSTRLNLEERLKSLVKSMEDSWLGCEKAALLGTLVSSEDEAMVRSVVKDCVTSDLENSQRSYIEQLLSAAPFLTDRQMREGLVRNVSSLEEEEVKKLIKTSKCRLSDRMTWARRHPVILILDSEVQDLPWECLPCLRECRQAMSRVPSLPFLHCLWTAHSSSHASVLTKGVAQDNVYYVLNPDKSLRNTEQKMMEVLKKGTYSSWEGVVGEAPEKQQLTRALQEKVRASVYFILLV